MRNIKTPSIPTNTETSSGRDKDDEPIESVVTGLITSLREIKEGKIHPISELWHNL